MIPFRILKNKIIDLKNIQKEDIDIEHIAHALSFQCRYNGQIPIFYSVAQHSILVADILYLETKCPILGLCGLLHDAAEAYIGDIVTPIKKNIPLINKLEDKILYSILSKYGVKKSYMEYKDKIDKVDYEMYGQEVNYFFNSVQNRIFQNISIEKCKKWFLEDFNRYTQNERLL